MRTFAPSLTVLIAGGFILIYGLVSIGCFPRELAISLARPAAVVLTFAVILLPIYYSQILPFSRRANHALDQLNLQETYNDVSTATIESQEHGFDDLLSVIERRRPEIENMEIDEIGRVAGFQDPVEDFFGRKVASGRILSHDIMYVEITATNEAQYGEKFKIPLVFGAIDSSIGVESSMSMLRRDIDDIAQTRANRYTAGIAVMWSTISILLTTI